MGTGQTLTPLAHGSYVLIGGKPFIGLVVRNMIHHVVPRIISNTNKKTFFIRMGQPRIHQPRSLEPLGCPIRTLSTAKMQIVRG